MRVYLTDDHPKKHHIRKGTLRKAITDPLTMFWDWWHMRIRYRVEIETNYKFDIGDEIVYSHYDNNVHKYRTGLVARIHKNDRLKWRCDLELVVLKDNQ